MIKQFIAETGEKNMTDRVDISRLMVEMRSLKAQTQAFDRPQGIAAKDIAGLRPNEGVNVGGTTQAPSFGELMEQAVNKVNDVQKASSALQEGFEQGNPNIDISDVMVASQKASVSFQAMVQVRNKLVEAYRDVMNMPI